jgi:pSer/pThr/pTyr-binding forkhead associated (FHA) protein
MSSIRKRGSLSVEIRLLQDDRVVHTEPLAGRALFVGRNPDNDLVLTEPTISGRHAVFHLDEAGLRLMLRDLASTNGTFIGDDRVSGPRQLIHGDRIRLGSSVELAVHIERREATPALPALPSLLVDLESGVAHPVRSDRVFVGGQPHCQVQVHGASTACITLHDSGEIWLSADEVEHAIELGTPFEVAGRELVFRSPASAFAATQRESVERTTYGYQLEVNLEGQTGPEAWLYCPRMDKRTNITAENRVSLLWILADQLERDLQAGTRPEQAGWCVDEDVMLGIWGRGWEKLGSNNYQVLLSRTRREFSNAGFDGWFIEKRRGHTRLRLQVVRVKR